jgi:hypothetical protein
MRIQYLLLATVAGVMTVTTPASSQSASAEADVRLDKISNQYICTFDRSTPGVSVRNEAAKAAGPMTGQVLHTYQHAIKGFAVRLPAQAGGDNPIAQLRANNPKITACEQDQVMKAFAPPPGKGPGGGGGGSGGEETPWGISRVRGGGSTSGNTAWVIDTGIDLDHPDLNVDADRSVSFVGSNPDDKNGHGTHVAGTIAAKAGNGIGVVGVSPGTSVVAVQVLGPSGSGSTSGVIAGVDHVKANGSSGDVANMSLGGSYSAALNEAVQNAAASGVKFAIAAGNSGANASNYSPASASGTNVYTVSASDASDKLASFSNYGSVVDWAEPGVGVKSTYKGGGYATLSGTSMAAPHLAGILVQGGVTQCGTITGDKDNSPDKIGCH